VNSFHLALSNSWKCSLRHSISDWIGRTLGNKFTGVVGPATLYQSLLEGAEPEIGLGNNCGHERKTTIKIHI
jgi:hypothetical protein